MSFDPSGQLLEAAARIGDDLLDASVPYASGGIGWRRGFDKTLTPAEDSGIFNGRAGEALLLAMLYDQTGEARYKRASLAILEALAANSCGDTGLTLSYRIGLGLNGVGAMVYALTRAARLLDEPGLLSSASDVARAVSSARLREDDELDFFWGSAGFLSGLAALLEELDEPDDALLSAARDCADHLMSRRQADPSTGTAVWATTVEVRSTTGVTKQKTPQTGFAHGTTGIAHALTRLFALTGDDHLYSAAMQAIHFESALFDEGSVTWRDYHGQPAERARSAWCHGSIGIGLARLAALPSARVEERGLILRDIQRAQTSAVGPQKGGMDTLCCGSLGRLDLLVELARRSHGDALSSVKARAASLANHLTAKGHEPMTDAYNVPRGPGLWQGVPGLAYIALRLAAPNRIPCILTFA